MSYKEFCNSLDFLARTDAVFLKKFLSCNKTGRNQFRPYLFFKECVTMEKFWNNEELEVMELLNPFILPEKLKF